MELYIEKEFLDNFYHQYETDSVTKGQQILANILTEYAEINWFIDCKIESIEQLEKLKKENPFFASRASLHGPITINTVKEHFFEKSNCKQTLIFTQNNENWFLDAENKGALCFSFSNYKDKIENIITRCHFKIDLSKKFVGWSIFSNINILPFNKIIINDGYILVDKDSQKMCENLFPLLKDIFNNNYKKNIDLEIFTKDLNSPQPKTPEQNKLEADKRFKKFKCVFSNYNVNLKIISNSLHTNHYDFHDRLIYLNFIIIDSAKGFNLLPHKNSNSQIIFETIFEKYTYNRLRSHIKMHEDYFERIKSLKTVNFKYIT